MGSSDLGIITEAGRFVVMATWDDAPHLTDEMKRRLWASIPPYQRDARSKGIPQLGSGAIYPVVEDDILCDPFPIPDYWPRAYAFDVGWNYTAAIWGTWNQEEDCVYLYAEYKKGQAEPAVHAHAINARGTWIPGVIDPASRGRSQADGRRLYTTYVNDLNLNLSVAQNAVEAGIFKVYERMTSNRLKVFRTLVGWREEFRLYRRDENGKVVKDNDHLMDSTRYLVMNGMAIAITQLEAYNGNESGRPDAESGRSGVTGY